MMDFLTFKKFISPTVLIVFYYIGAVLIPLAIFLLRKWIIRKINTFYSAEQMLQKMLLSALTTKQKAQLLFAFILCFLCMELFWRMLFEYLIAYMQIRDALILK